MQGEVLSPYLFAMFLADMEEFFLQRNCGGIALNCLTDILLLLYADDAVFLAESPSKLNRILLVLRKYCDLNFLTVNTEKTKIMVFSRNGSCSTTPFFYDGINIEVVKNFEYLGVNFSSSARFGTMAKNSLKKAKAQTGAVLSLLAKSKCTVWATRVELFNSLARSTLFNCLALWSTGYEDALERVQLLFFKQLLCWHYQKHC